MFDPLDIISVVKSSICPLRVHFDVEATEGQDGEGIRARAHSEQSKIASAKICCTYLCLQQDLAWFQLVAQLLSQLGMLEKSRAGCLEAVVRSAPFLFFVPRNTAHLNIFITPPTVMSLSLKHVVSKCANKLCANLQNYIRFVHRCPCFEVATRRTRSASHCFQVQPSTPMVP